MKKWKNGALAFFCAVALLLGLVGPQAHAAGDVIWLAVNDQIVPLSASTMPILYNNSYYVPYVVFDRNYMRTNAGIQTDLGILVAATSNKVTLYTMRRQLVYDLDAGTCVGSGENYPRAIVRGGITYVPLNSVRQFFAEDGLSTYQCTIPEYGTFIRLTTPSAYFGNSEFVDAATPSLSDFLRKYHGSQSPSPSSSPAQTTAPSASASPSPSPSPSPGDKPDKSGVRAYLSIMCSQGANLSIMLDTLARERVSALFFFRPEDLAENEVMVRRIIGSGHAIGLTVAGGPAEDAKARLREGNRLLSLIAHTNTRTVTLENGDAATTATLLAEGWSVWSGNVSGTTSASAAAYSASLMRSVDSKRASARITLNDDARSASALPLLINALRAEKYTIRLAIGGDIG